MSRRRSIVIDNKTLRRTLQLPLRARPQERAGRSSPYLSAETFTDLLVNGTRKLDPEYLAVLGIHDRAVYALSISSVTNKYAVSRQALRQPKSPEKSIAATIPNVYVRAETSKGACYYINKMS